MGVRPCSDGILYWTTNDNNGAIETVLYFDKATLAVFMELYPDRVTNVESTNNINNVNNVKDRRE